MKQDVYKQYIKLRIVHTALSFPLSLSAYFVAYFFISLHGYSSYGPLVFGDHLKAETTFWAWLGSFFGTALASYFYFSCLPSSWIYFFWPYFLKNSKSAQKIRKQGSYWDFGGVDDKK